VLTAERDSDRKRINYNQSRAIAKSDDDCDLRSAGKLSPFVLWLSVSLATLRRQILLEMKNISSETDTKTSIRRNGSVYIKMMADRTAI